MAIDLAHAVAGSPNEHFAWSSLREFNIELPTATPWGGRALVVLDMIHPIGMSPQEVTVTMTAGYRVAQWDLGRAEHYSWRADFVLMQLTTLLAREARFSLLAVPGLLDAVMDDVIPRVPTHARLLVRTDLPGLHRHIGGHGADDGAIERVLATFVFGHAGWGPAFLIEDRPQHRDERTLLPHFRLALVCRPILNGC